MVRARARAREDKRGRSGCVLHAGFELPVATATPLQLAVAYEPSSAAELSETVTALPDLPALCHTTVTDCLWLQAVSLVQSQLM